MGHSLVLQYMYMLYNQISVVRISITSCLLYFFVIIFKNLSPSYFVIYNTVLLTIGSLLCNRTRELIPPI